jgi:hypothetical protein
MSNAPFNEPRVPSASGAISPTRRLDYGRAASTYATENDYVPPCPGNPWTTILTQPRDTFLWLMGTNPQLHVLKIIIVGAIVGTIGGEFDQEGGPKLSGSELALKLVLAVPVGLLFSLAGFYIGGWLLRVTGSWLGGTGTSERCRCATAWGQLPLVALSIVLLPILIALWVLDLPQMPLLIATMLLGLLQLGVGIYSIVLMSIGLGVAHRFNAWMGFAAALIAMALVIACVLAIVVPIIFLL